MKQESRKPHITRSVVHSGKWVAHWAVKLPPNVFGRVLAPAPGSYQLKTGDTPHHAYNRLTGRAP